jgi:hypothetical protein
MSESPKRTAESVDAPVLESVDQKKAKMDISSKYKKECWEIIVDIHDRIVFMQSFLDTYIDSDDEMLEKGEVEDVASELNALAHFSTAKAEKLLALIVKIKEEGGK